MRFLSTFVALFLLCGLAPRLARADIAIVPPTLHGCGVIVLTAASTQIVAANVTLCPNSPPFPTAALGFPLAVKNQSTSAGYIVMCWLGGVCSTVGEVLAIGEGAMRGVQFLNLGPQPPTATAPFGATLWVEW